MLTVYTTAPSDAESGSEYRDRIVDVSRWTERAGHRGLLVYTDNSLNDPWQVAQLILENTASAVPLVAVQPLFRHPFDTARAISSIGYLYGRSVDLNLVTGGFPRHLQEFRDDLGHDDRYVRLVEHGQLIERFLSESDPISHDGRFYSVKSLRLTIPLDASLAPRIFIAGTSDACVAAQKELGAARLSYPRFIGEYDVSTAELRGNGIRLGIIARDTSEEAWRVAKERFPHDELGEEMHDLASMLVESKWHQSLSADAQRSSAARDCYWLYPFRTYRTFCPYFVGDYGQVADSIRQYLELGISTLILDVPIDEDDLHHSSIAIEMAKSDFAQATIG